jgi:hypothetical protein
MAFVCEVPPPYSVSGFYTSLVYMSDSEYANDELADDEVSVDGNDYESGGDYEFDGDVLGPVPGVDVMAN